MEVLQSIWEFIKNVITQANSYGLPIPLLVAMLVLFYLSRRRTSWEGREKYYLELLGNLGIWGDTLLERSTYYDEPGSEYSDEHTKTEHYQALSSKGGNALTKIKDTLPIARLFLSKRSIEIIEELISDHWAIGEHIAVSNADYLNLSYPKAQQAYSEILKEAKRDLKWNNFGKAIASIPALKK